MEPSFQPKIEHGALEKDIERLVREIQELKGKMPQATPEKELVKSALGARILPQTGPAVPPATAQPSPVLPGYLQQESPEIQLKVEELLDITFHKGIDAAVEEAKKYGPFILDALHDSLTGKIYDELKTRNLL
ncbi:MAG: hypothetical protein HZB99_01605 [Candidatus Harrisonbacteria bacterium]|nr:hypothetical protein [Candidatus Harrisonbacteria bacterium]